MRLAAYLARCGIASRRAAEQIILDGKVKVNNRIHKDLAVPIDPETDEVTYRDRVLKIVEKVYYAVHKPKGYVCTNKKDGQAEDIVLDLLPVRHHLFTVGRLDKDSEGLILVTNDGELAQILTHPSFEIVKQYRVLVRGDVNPHVLDDIEENGIRAFGENYRVESVSIKRETGDGAVLNFTLTEGKNREIRNICEALGLRVRSLRRISVAGIRLARLPAGAWRPLTGGEVKQLQKLAKAGPKPPRRPTREVRDDFVPGRRHNDKGPQGRAPGSDHEGDFFYGG